MTRSRGVVNVHHELTEQGFCDAALPRDARHLERRRRR